MKTVKKLGGIAIVPRDCVVLLTELSGAIDEAMVVHYKREDISPIVCSDKASKTGENGVNKANERC